MYSISRRSTSLVVVTILCGFGCGEKVDPSAQPAVPRKSLESTRVSPPLLPPTAPTLFGAEPDVVVKSQPNVEPPVDPAAPILKVEVSGAKSSNGVYFFALFDDEEKLKQRKDPILAERFPASEIDVVWTIEKLPPGEYSIAVFHDANENDILDRHALGFPLEAYGFSRNARGKFGPPPYERIKFAVGSDPQELQIHVE